MPAQKFNAGELIQKYKLGQCSDEEQKLVLGWYDKLPETTISPDQKDVDQAGEEIWKRLNQSIQPKPIKELFPRIFYRIAAILILGLLCFGGAFYFAGNRKIYNVTNQSRSIIQYTIKTSKGGQHQVILPDGSRAWLNAASSLTYPANFNDRLREVSMTGEVYFEIAQNKQKPFKVRSGKMEVKVLGTHFNVSAYEEDRTISTTLFEGSVAINTENQNIKIHPGQVAVLNKINGDMIAIPADRESALAWKNGYFIFNDAHIKEIMGQLSRWYDVPVSYHGDLSGLNFSVRISRKSSIREVLNILESTGTIHFTIEERRITVSQK